MGLQQLLVKMSIKKYVSATLHKCDRCGTFHTAISISSMYECFKAKHISGCRQRVIEIITDHWTLKDKSLVLRDAGKAAETMDTNMNSHLSPTFN